MKYFSAFSGIGGFELGIQKAHESNIKQQHIRKKSKQKKRPQGGVGAAHQHDKMFRTTDRSAPLCVGFSEIDKYATQIYQKHFPEHKNYGDIKTINEKTLPDFDLFVGGFPCQAFSIAGKRKGFDDTRGTLFFDIARILKEKRPKYILLENVKGLLSHDNGNTYRTILSTLIGLGYDIQAMVLNAKDFGVPQNRERVFIAGCLGGFTGRQVFPIGESNSESVEKDRVQTEIVSGTIAVKNQSPQAQFDASTTLISKAVRSGGRKSPYLSKQNWDTYEIGTKIRRLTPLECERLMGYPDGWTEGLSDTQRYKTLGNGIVSNVVAEVVKKLL